MNQRFSKTFNYPTVWGYSSEAEMYEGIWNDRPHVSFISGLPIINPVPANFAHVLPKALNRYPEFRFNPENVILVLWDEHNLIDEGSADQRARYAELVKSADFSALEMLTNSLKEKYEEMFGA